jgi:hypothetical protein
MLHIMEAGQMKSKLANEVGNNAPAAGGFSALCLRSCQRILTHIQRARNAIFSESRRAVAAQEHMLRLALNEAEALAWQTGYPHLVFPALAMEKAQEVVDWRRHQRAVRHEEPRLAVAA